MRAVGPLVLLVAVAIAVLATPIPVLTIGNSRAMKVVWFDEDHTYVYSYVNSVYRAEVHENHTRRGDRLVVLNVRSPDIQAVEYFRWEGPIHRLGDEYVQFAPPNGVRRLSINETPVYDQRIATPHWAINLAAAFGDGNVEIIPERLPALTALAYGWRP